jgi:hypothetical protein
MTIFGKILAVLNILAAAGFAFLALKNHSVRQAWAYAAYSHDRAMHGQPIQDQYVDSRLPRERYLADKALAPESEALKAQFGGAGQPVNTQKKELENLKNVKGGNSFFAAVNQAAKQFADASKNKEDDLKTVLLPLAGTGEQYRQYLDRIARATATGKAGALLEEAARRWMLAQAILPLEELRAGSRREQTARAIADLGKPYADLEKLLAERLAEVLTPQAEDTLAAADRKKKADKERGLILILVSQRTKPLAKGQKASGIDDTNKQYQLRYKRSVPDRKVTIWILDAASGKEAAVSADPATLLLTNVEGQPKIEMRREGQAYAAQDDALGTDNVLSGVITLTLSGKPESCYFREREASSQRRDIAYALLTLSQVKRPDGKPLLDALTDKRVEAVVGRTWYNDALERQTAAFRQIADRRLQEIEYDLQSFADKYNLEIKVRLPDLLRAIKQHEEIKQDWDDQKTRHNDQLTARKEHHKETLAKLKKERDQATAALADLTMWQQRLFEAQKQGAGVAEENQRLEREIRKRETGR